MLEVLACSAFAGVAAWPMAMMVVHARGFEWLRRLVVHANPQGWMAWGIQCEQCVSAWMALVVFSALLPWWPLPPLLAPFGWFASIGFAWMLAERREEHG